MLSGEKKEKGGGRGGTMSLIEKKKEGQRINLVCSSTKKR